MPNSTIIISQKLWQSSCNQLNITLYAGPLSGLTNAQNPSQDGRYNFNTALCTSALENEASDPATAVAAEMQRRAENFGYGLGVALGKIVEKFNIAYQAIRDNNNLFHSAVLAGDADALEVEDYFSINQQNANGESPLSLAITIKREEMIKPLLSKGALVDKNLFFYQGAQRSLLQEFISAQERYLHYLRLRHQQFSDIANYMVLEKAITEHDGERLLSLYKTGISGEKPFKPFLASYGYDTMDVTGRELASKHWPEILTHSLFNKASCNPEALINTPVITPMFESILHEPEKSKDINAEKEQIIVKTQTRRSV